MGRHMGGDFRVGIILHGQGKRPVILGAGGSLHTVCHFLLHHDRDARKGHMAFKEPHDDGGCNVVRQVCYHFYGGAVIFLLCQTG